MRRDGRLRRLLLLGTLALVLLSGGLLGSVFLVPPVVLSRIVQ